jgi:hypothetical protein
MLVANIDWLLTEPTAKFEMFARICRVQSVLLQANLYAASKQVVLTKQVLFLNCFVEL